MLKIVKKEFGCHFFKLYASLEYKLLVSVGLIHCG